MQRVITNGPAIAIAQHEPGDDYLLTRNGPRYGPTVSSTGTQAPPSDTQPSSGDGSKTTTMGGEPRALAPDNSAAGGTSAPGGGNPTGTPFDKLASLLQAMAASGGGGVSVPDNTPATTVPTSSSSRNVMLPLLLLVLAGAAGYLWYKQHHG